MCAFNVYVPLSIPSPVFEEHKEEYSDEKVTDFVDVYLREMQQQKNVQGTTVEGETLREMVD